MLSTTHKHILSFSTKKICSRLFSSGIKIKPLFDNVLIKRETKETKTKSGLFIPGSATKKNNVGVVVGAGDGKVVDGVTVPLTVKAGDRVLLSEFGGTKIVWENEDYFLIREHALLAIIRK
ncbi:10 kda heat shock protein [Anaeramoeba flamelloides]|uniref:10 kDa heat shock protein n=1 Tax=Anaeramoeba flamelloides TaxID=1746091 RepID=A0ABQ8Z894_9EUKA|nr:10 kda heat shock protein [Anaeramoeba flamelloides]